MIEKIKNKIREANKFYREGNPIMSDNEWDSLLKTLYKISPNDELLEEVGFKIEDSSRKVKLPIKMDSMNKIHTIGELEDWIRLKNIPNDIEFVLTPKYDGLSLCVEEVTKWASTRGDGEWGQYSSQHYKKIGNHLDNNIKDFKYTYGEVIMSNNIFSERYSDKFANPRNLVSGLLNSKEPSDYLGDCVYIKYGAIGGEFKKKSDILDRLNEGQSVKVPYLKLKILDITEDMLVDVFNKWSKDFIIDGVIIEVNDIKIQEKLGRETSTNNPVWARAFKSEKFEKSAVTLVNGISWNVSKNGLLKPTIHVDPIKLDGVTISNVTGNNARYIKEMGIGIGSNVVVIRSGMVIPKIIKVLNKVEFELPDIGYDIKWNDAGIELMTVDKTEDQTLKMLISFFEILESDNVSEGVITQLWDAGYRDLKSILNLKKSDLEKLDRFGTRKSEIVYNSIQKSIESVELSKVQHASGLFNGLGSKKLKKLEHFSEKPKLEDIIEIDGFAVKSAEVYLNGYDKFKDFIKDLPITISTKSNESEKKSNSLLDKTFVFTGVRRPDLVKIIEDNGGKQGSSVSKNTSYLVCVDKDSTSSKMEKARKMGIIILNVEDLEEMLNDF